MTVASATQPVLFQAAPDAAGAVVLELPDFTTSVRLESPEAAFVELEVGPGVRFLDLRACGVGRAVRLLLRGVGVLERLLLPNAPGVKLALALTDVSRQPDLDVRGTVSSLTLSWSEGGRIRAVEWDGRGRKTFENLRIGRPDAPPPADVEGWVVLGGVLARDALGKPPPFVWLVDADAPDGLELKGKLDVFELLDTDTPALVFDECRALKVRPMRGLRRIVGHVRQLLLRNGSVNGELVIEGAVEVADLLGVRCEALRVLGCHDLTLEGCEVVERIVSLSNVATLKLSTPDLGTRDHHELRWKIATPGAEELDARFADGSSAERDAMLDWAGRAAHHDDLETALRVFSAAVDGDHRTAAEMWHERTRIHDRVVRHSLRGQWAWPMPPEQLALAVYETDVFLWLRVYAENPRHALRRAGPLVRRGSPENVAALLHVARHDSVEPVERDTLLDLARQALDAGTAFAEASFEHNDCRRAVWLEWRTGKRAIHPRSVGHAPTSRAAHRPPSPVELAWVELGLEALHALAGVAAADAVAASFAAWLSSCLPGELGIRGLGRLRAHGCHSALAGLERVRSLLEEDRTLDATERARLRGVLAQQYLLADATPRFGAETLQPRAAPVTSQGRLGTL